MTPILKKKISEKKFHHRGDPYYPKNLKRPCGGIKIEFFEIFFADIILLDHETILFHPGKSHFKKSLFLGHPNPAGNFFRVGNPAGQIVNPAGNFFLGWKSCWPKS